MYKKPSPLLFLVSKSIVSLKKTVKMMEIYQYSFKVGPESIDILRHVNNREYLRWMEMAAMKHASLLGCGAKECLQQGEVWVAREHWIEYLRPCYEGDELTIYSWVETMDGPRSLRRYAIKRGARLVCVGATEWVYIDYKSGKVMDVPADVASRFTIIGSDDERLIDLGIARGVRFEPHYPTEKLP